MSSINKPPVSLDLDNMTPCEQLKAWKQTLFNVASGRLTQVRYENMWQIYDRGDTRAIEREISRLRRLCPEENGPVEKRCDAISSQRTIQRRWGW